MQDLGPSLIGLAAVATAFGTGIWRVWSSISKRIDQLETGLDDCRERDANKDRQLHTMGLCLRLLIPEVARLDPESETLNQVRSLLDQSFPIDPETPPDMIALLDRIEAGKPRPRARRKT